MVAINKEPFFIVGCVRSGTTLLRDLLKQHPNLNCPEETHFFRWSDPFGTKAYEKNYTSKELFKQHRMFDSVDNFGFFYTLQKGGNRKELMHHYMRLFLEANEGEGGRWFDKTPQNVYGLLLISGMYPEAKFIHVHRHPYNVITSLKKGRVLKQQELRGAINFWVESLTILKEYKRGFPHRLLEVSYEKLTSETTESVKQILNFIGEPQFDPALDTLPVYPEKNLFQEALSEEDIALIDEQCEDLMKHYGYTK